MANETKRKWTVFFLIKIGDDSIFHAITMLNDLRNTPFDAKISVTLCLSVNKSNLAAIESGDHSSRNGADSTRIVVFYKLAASQTPTSKFLNDLEKIYYKEKIDITNPVDLEKAIKENILKSNPAERYMFFTWDHGRPYGIFVEQKNDSTRRKTVSFKIYQEVKEKVLTIDELSIAIRGAFGEKKIDVLIMMNCYTHSADAMYALKDTVSHLVAPEGVIELTGYNYAVIFGTLAANTDITGQELARIAVESFPGKNPEFTKLIDEAQISVALFASNLDFLSFTVSTLNLCVELLTELLPEASKYILRIRKMSRVNNTLPLIDFFTFMQNIQPNHTNDIINKNILMARDIASITKKMLIIKEYTTNTPSNSQGMSLFFPNVPFSKLPTSKDSPFVETSFWKETLWRTFLQKVLPK